MIARETLEVEKLCLRFAGLDALVDVDLRVEPGETIAIVGPNGAGKTSLLNCISGLYRATSGRISLGASALQSLPAHAIVKAGVSRTFQHIELVPGLSVRENVMAARQQRYHLSLAWSLLYFGPARREERKQRELVAEILSALGIAHLADAPAGSLSLANQKLVALARALASDPHVVLLDEPASGLAPEEKQALFALLPNVRRRFELSLIIVEHDLALVTKLCERFIVMNFGHKLADGAPEEVLSRPEVMTAYLGAAAQPTVGVANV